jgi:mannose-6-phosphate isomerase-like protein (cupin superfamily)
MTQELKIAGKTKEKVFAEVESYLSSFIRIRYEDSSRPWGGFFTIDETDTDIFIQKYYPFLSRQDLSISGKLSPKILLVEPGKKLSWQYHHRRAEIWKVIAGKAMVITSDTDEENEQRILECGDIVELNQGERHRLIGMEEWGVIAEIWRHTDPANPSNEDDIVRVQDDFGR